jgi:hypothetical protein
MILPHYLLRIDGKRDGAYAALGREFLVPSTRKM